MRKLQEIQNSKLRIKFQMPAGERQVNVNEQSQPLSHMHNNRKWWGLRGWVMAGHRFPPKGSRGPSLSGRTGSTVQPDLALFPEKLKI